MQYKPAIQAAGHEGILQDASGALFIKPNVPQQEIDFYEAMEAGHLEDMLSITCTFMGLVTEQTIETPETKAMIDEIEQTQEVAALQDQLVAPGEGRSGIVLQNLTYGYTQPNILDVKLGSTLYDSGASPEKAERLKKVSESTTSGSLHLRVAGMNIYDESTGERKWYDKHFGRELTDETVTAGVGQFFPPEFDREMCRAVAEGIVGELDRILEVLSQTELRMISASILIVYEGDSTAFEDKLSKIMSETEPGNVNGISAIESKSGDEISDGDHEGDEEDDDDDPHKLYTVKLIDFAHSRFTPGESVDQDSILGLKNLISIFDSLEKQFDREAEEGH